MSQPQSLSNEATTVAQLDPSTPVLREDIRADIPRENWSVFGHDVWNVAPQSEKPTLVDGSISFVSSPDRFRVTLKRLVWCLLNLRTPIELLQRTTAVRDKLTVGSTMSIFESDLRPFTQWLDDKNIEKLSDVTDNILEEYGDRVKRLGVGRNSKMRRLFGVTRIWLLSPYMPDEDKLIRPPWEEGGIEHLVGPSDWSAENKTPPLHPQTMSPLLLWSLRFVQDFSKDILNAAKEKRRLESRLRQHASRGDQDTLKQYLDDCHRNGRGLPGFIPRGMKIQLANEYIAAYLNIGLNAVRGSNLAGLSVARRSPLSMAIHGRIDGEQWIKQIDYYETGTLTRFLSAACLVIVAYLSGMRGEECRALQRGCCRAIAINDGKAKRYEIVGKTFKAATDREGNTVPSGIVREHPWIVVEPVADAIAVMEELHDYELLFPAEAFNDRRCKIPGQAVNYGVITRLLEKFIRWCNATAEGLQRTTEHIPEDPDGRVTLRRFRRTLAWFIYRLPAGRVALGIQYGHLRGYTSDGYGSRVSNGLRDVFPMEEAFAIADTLNEAADRLAEGERVSGPAADRYIAGVTEFRMTYQGQYLTPRQAAQIRRTPPFRIYDNGSQALACCYDATKALCHPSRSQQPDAKDGPDLTRCNPMCANVARTDEHIERLEKEIKWHESQAGSKLTPQPIQERHRQRIATLQEVIEEHRQTRKQS